MVSRREDEWNLLYVELRALLARFGTESAFGEKDYWLCDDDWGGRLHKVYVSRIRFLSPSLASGVQALLSKFPTWGVLFQLDVAVAVKLDVAVAVNKKAPPEGVVVYSHSIREDWNKSELFKLFGRDFLWADSKSLPHQ